MNRFIIESHNSSKFIKRNDLINSNKLFIKRGFSLSNKNSSLSQSIYLDGAFKGPLFDSKNKIFSLDHHENCVRQITKSTCEQALLFAKYGTFDNTIYDVIGNDPDLDTVIAGWILLNIDEIRQSEVYQKLLPLVLVEGNIDSYGFGYEDILGLSKDVILQEKNRIEWLREDEIKFKQLNKWGTIDYVEYTLSVFNKLDEFLLFNLNKNYTSEYRVRLKYQFILDNGKHLLFIEDENLGIYDVEEAFLKNNNDVQCVILSNGTGKYSIKLSGILSNFSLDFVWMSLSNAEMLAKINKGINANTNPDLYFTNWGGSSNIGGSPRYSNGRSSYLETDDIIQLVANELNNQ